MKWVAVQFVKSFGGERNIFKFYKTHGTILLRSEAETFVSTLFRKHGFEFVFRGVDGEISHVESVTRRVLVSWVDRWKVVTLIVLAAELVTDRRSST